jgi:hypothetical protein
MVKDHKKKIMPPMANVEACIRGNCVVLTAMD